MSGLFGGGGGSSSPAPVYNEPAAKETTAEQSANANKKRVQEQTDTVKTSSLGLAGADATKKKTVLGG